MRDFLFRMSILGSLIISVQRAQLRGNMIIRFQIEGGDQIHKFELEYAKRLVLPCMLAVLRLILGLEDDLFATPRPGHTVVP
jgi:hypothetical protein